VIDAPKHNFQKVTFDPKLAAKEYPHFMQEKPAKHLQHSQSILGSIYDYFLDCLRNNFNFYYNKKLVGQKESVNDVIKKYNKKLGGSTLKRF